MTIKFEVCAGSLNSAIIANKGGADQIELCSALSVGGLTPSIGLIDLVKSSVNIPVHVLIRPREGNFNYTKLEKSIIIKDIIEAKKYKIDGIVVGALTTTNEIDIDFMMELKNAAGEISCTFHRAFDLIQNKFKSIDLLIDLNFKRILTSGGKTNAWSGRDQLKKIISYAGKGIEIMAGGGINKTNAKHLIEFTNVTSIHSSAKSMSTKQADSLFPDEIESDLQHILTIKQILKDFN